MDFAAGLVTYTVLMIGSTVTQRILARVANAPENEPTQTKPHASEDNASSPA